jgi:hypothetical protein
MISTAISTSVTELDAKEFNDGFKFWNRGKKKNIEMVLSTLLTYGPKHRVS